ncbi:ATP-binding protein, partial [Candidatus Fermentibacterales bacterium]|nr:ATP-binding protein [Candidatus Fermentibacterales bacterium]
LSGKGGTGKTCVTAALAHHASQSLPVALVDADVDASNLELLLSPQVLQQSDFMSGTSYAVIDSACTGCGRCSRVCRFGAVLPDDRNGGEKPVYRIDGLACEGCGACFHECPERAIEASEALSGTIYESQTSYGPLFHARLRAGAENSGKLISRLREMSRKAAEARSLDLIIIDGPPGIGCPVISASTGADLAIVVTEPGVSAAADLERALEACRHFGVETVVTINKADLSPDNADRIRCYCERAGIPLLPDIPFDPSVLEAVVLGVPIPVHAPDSPAAAALRDLWLELGTRTI